MPLGRRRSALVADSRRMTKLLFHGARGVLLVGLLLALLLGLAAAAALQREPSVVLTAAVDHRDVARAVALLRAHDPRRVPAGRVRQLWLGERDLDVLLSHAGQRWLGAVGRVRVERGAATLQFSARAPAWPGIALFGRWINVELRLRETTALPAIESASIGRLPLPSALAARMAPWLAARAGLAAEARLAAEVVQQVRFAPRLLLVTYAWPGDGRQRVMATLLRPEDRERLRPYHDRIVELAARAEPAWQAPLAELLVPLFELARIRSAAEGADAAAENRAAIVALTLYASGRGAGGVLPADWPRARPMRLLLAGRDDFPLHFLVSAALVVEGSSPLAQAIGLYKEVADARGGSGFSFNDMAANRAGTRFGELAVQAPARLQAAVAGGLAERDFMPEVADLPEFLSQAELRRRYGGVGAPAYNALVEEIARRVDALPLLR